MGWMNWMDEWDGWIDGWIRKYHTHELKKRQIPLIYFHSKCLLLNLTIAK
jgi:hypothetical protein